MIKRYKSVKERRRARVRAKIKGTSDRPRLSVYRSNRLIFAQIINDEKGVTLVAASEKGLAPNKKRGIAETRKKQKHGKISAPPQDSASPRSQGKYSKTERARLVGKILAQKALKAGIKKVVFDRGSYQYHGRVKALAEGAREGGLVF